MCEERKRMVIMVCLVFFLGLIVQMVVMLAPLREDKTARESILVGLEAKEKVNLRESFGGGWDTLYLFKPYSEPSVILGESGVRLSGRYPVTYRDDLVMLGFVKDGILIGYVNLPRDKVENEKDVHERFRRKLQYYTVADGKLVLE